MSSACVCHIPGEKCAYCSVSYLTSNPILAEVVKLFAAQQEKGLEKYGELVNVDSYSLIGWIEHAQQECMDKLVYLECIKQKIQGSGPDESESGL